jgi:hypothetical protein
MHVLDPDYPQAAVPEPTSRSNLSGEGFRQPSRRRSNHGHVPVAAIGATRPALLITATVTARVCGVDFTLLIHPLRRVETVERLVGEPAARPGRPAPAFSWGLRRPV